MGHFWKEELNYIAAKLLHEKKYPTLKDVLITLEPADISAVFEELDEERTPLLFRTSRSAPRLSTTRLR